MSTRSALALLYLILLGSIVACSAYIWLMRHTTPARVATYAYVNPVVALFLGFSLGGESLTARTLAAAALIITSVVVLQLGRSRPAGSARRATRPDEPGEGRTAEAATVQSGETGVAGPGEDATAGSLQAGGAS